MDCSSFSNCSVVDSSRVGAMLCRNIVLWLCRRVCILLLTRSVRGRAASPESQTPEPSSPLPSGYAEYVSTPLEPLIS
jgi:hypothetical protein